MFGLGTSEIILIALVILLLFGGKKLPELMRGLGGGVKEFRQAMRDDQKPSTHDTSDTTQPKSSQDQNQRSS
ncbi:MAG: twin-arginine translocase TatA/TatE family subunit [bacterium]|nr:twin-arginine translocase TatA/TatE family subunit [bacterium]